MKKGSCQVTTLCTGATRGGGGGGTTGTRGPEGESIFVKGSVYGTSLISFIKTLLHWPACLFLWLHDVGVTYV